MPIDTGGTGGEASHDAQQMSGSRMGYYYVVLLSQAESI